MEAFPELLVIFNFMMKVKSEIWTMIVAFRKQYDNPHVWEKRVENLKVNYYQINLSQGIYKYITCIW